jgi:thioredoxin 1
MAFIFSIGTLDGCRFRVHVPRMALLLTESNFQAEVIDSSVPVLVDFWAEWCGPCKAIGPIIDQLADDVAGQAKVGKVNVDNARELAVKYGVRSIPFLLFFQNGEVKDQIVGANVTKDQLKAKLLALA